MGQRQVNLLDPTTDDNAANNAWYTVKTDPATGISYRSAVSQEKKAYAPFKVKYVATGSEGSTLTIAALANKEILMASREAGVIYEVTSSPDNTEFTFDGTDIHLGLAVTGAGERFQFIFKTPS